MKGKSFIEPLFNGIINGTVSQFVEIVNNKNYPLSDEDLIIEEYSNPTLKGVNLAQKREIGILPNGTSYYEIVHVMSSVYKIGETVYLKEPYSLVESRSKFARDGVKVGTVIYKYDGGWGDKTWRNKLFMPAKYARYFIEITAVRCERLQDISDGDCEREGICPVWENGFVVSWSNKSDGKTYTTRKEAYAALIDKINGKGTWESNPYVWVYNFKLLKNK
jgi:hypothetical protein